MSKIKFDSEATDYHKCQSYRDGDWIIFRCPHCSDYERRLNWRTGEMKARNTGGHLRHMGTYVPLEYMEALESTN